MKANQLQCPECESTKIQRTARDQNARQTGSCQRCGYKAAIEEFMPDDEPKSGKVRRPSH
ncbi:hypothetical protein ACFQHU_06795 [Pseudobowmanella zhangzhouensis]|nr:hypothetical protein TK45_00390 [Bowmanella sp. JS7-9]